MEFPEPAATLLSGTIWANYLDKKPHQKCQTRAHYLPARTGVPSLEHLQADEALQSAQSQHRGGL